MGGPGTTTSRNFYPRSPCGERPFRVGKPPANSLYFYPRSPCGERRIMSEAMTKSEKFLSTLSLRRATANRKSDKRFSLYFYPRSPCGERRCRRLCTVQLQQYFYPRSPCGERQGHLQPIGRAPCISIHALLAESDGVLHMDRWLAGLFLSTLSLRRATMFVNLRVLDGSISIHALLAESDK